MYPVVSKIRAQSESLRSWTREPVTNSTGRGILQPRFPRPALRLPEGNSILDSREQNRTTSINNLPRINQRRELEAGQQLESIGVLNHGTSDGLTVNTLFRTAWAFIFNI